MEKLKKPKKQTHRYYDYHECRDYLQKKFGYDERDYAKIYNNGKYDKDIECLDFWYWLCEHSEIHNGCFVYFSKENLDDLDGDEWVKEIYGHYIDEFADKNGELTMYAWW